MVEHGRDIRRHIAECELGVWFVALAGAAIVDNENLEPRFHQLEERLAPSPARAAESHDQRHRLALPSNLVAELEPVFGPGEIANCCHVGISSSPESSYDEY